MVAPAPPTAARLSSLSTNIVSQILELTRTARLGLPSPSLTQSVLKNLALLSNGIESLERGAQSIPVLVELKAQHARLVELAEGLGLNVPRRAGTPTGRLVETDDGPPDDDSSDALPLLPLSTARPPHTAVTFPDSSDDETDRLEEDESTLRRANTEVMQMQRQLINDQDDTLDSLSSAISRQHHLSLNISSELEMHEGLLESTDAALDRTATRLQRAGKNLKTVSSGVKATGTTGIIILLIIILVVLIKVL